MRPRLAKVVPISPVDDQRDCRPRYLEQISDELLGHSLCRVQCANGVHVSLGQDGFVVLAAIHPSPMSMLIVSVLQNGGPSKIGLAIVVSIIVPMRDFMLRRWWGAVKNPADYGVQIGRMAFAKMHCLIAPIFRLRYPQQCAAIAHRSAVLVGDNAINRPQPSETRCLISRMIWYCSPFFALCHGSESSTITILAARV